MLHRRTLPLTLLATMVLAGCDQLDRLKKATPQTPVGRFQVLQGTARLSSGNDAPITLRMDTETGETWILATEGYRWVGVEDDLRRAGTYDPTTKKLEWGVKAPDGRDLNELSKEELIRYLSAEIRNGQRPNPKDPLGLFEAEKAK